jgi:hypothetical protein
MVYEECRLMSCKVSYFKRGLLYARLPSPHTVLYNILHHMYCLINVESRGVLEAKMCEIVLGIKSVHM